MLNKLFKRMAPLVAGVVIVSSTVAALATYPYIESITKGSTSASVSVAYGGGVPPGHTGPRSTSYGNYYWWTNQQYHGQNVLSINYSYGTVTNVNVYVYPDDMSSDYSYAYVNDVWGTVIYNGP